jgi:Condensation domain
LRTTYGISNGALVQRVGRDCVPDFSLIDASGASRDELLEHIAAEARRPFDLGRDACLRARVWQRPSGPAVLALVMHHIAIDFWSLVTIVRELSTLYEAKRTGGDSALPELSLAYTDFVAWQARVLEGSTGARLLKYWRQRLVPPLPVLGYVDSAPDIGVGGAATATQAPFAVDERLTAELREFSAAHGTTLYATVLSAFAVLLYRRTLQEDLLIGCPVSGRSQPEFAGIVGNFTDPVPLRLDLTNNPRFEVLLARVRATLLDALDYQGLPLPLLVQHLQPKRALSAAPLFQVWLAWDRPQNSGNGADSAFPPFDTSQNAGRTSALLLDRLMFEQVGSAFPLTLVVGEGRTSLEGSVAYDGQLIGAVTAAEISRDLTRILEEVVTAPQREISEFWKRPHAGAIA